ncbi:hypothetical protein VTN02DRAFT_3152 [Thermoascus thermophilus]
MAWYSILPPHLTAFETWFVRLFIVLGLATIGPWAALIVFDFLLYIFRVALYEMPVIGGRARGGLRPRAPSLSERPNGHRRAFSLRGVEWEASGTQAGAGDKNKGSEFENNQDADEGFKRKNHKEDRTEEGEME